MPPREPHKPAHPPDGGRAARKGEPAVEKISHFILKRKLGEGAVGQVWLAHDRALDRDVAVKLVRSSGANNENQVRAFIREARAAARLNHPNIVMIHHVGQDDGRVFIVMEYVEAGSLGDELGDKGKLPWRDATQAVRDAAAGLEAAHQAGLTHRDVKPSNLLRSVRGLVKVVDFGLAHNDGADLQATQTQDGVVLGSPAYMSPEQCHGKDVDQRSDLYSLTCTYYHLLTGELPFPGASMPAVMYDHCHAPFPDARKVVRAIPDGVLRILARGSQKQPQNRFPSAAEMRADLDAVLGTPEPSPAFDSGSNVRPVGDVPRWRTKRAIWSTATAAIGLLLLLAFVIHRAHVPPRGASPTADAPPIQGAPGLAQHPQQQPPSETVVAPKPPIPVLARANPELLPAPIPPSRLDSSGHRVIDLMPLIDPAQDMSCGRWTLANGSLAGAGDDPNDFRTGDPDTKYALFFPYFPPAEYDMRVSFTPQLGQPNPEVEFLLQRDQGAFQLRIDYGPQHLVGFPGFDKSKESADHSSVVPMAAPTAPGRAHQVIVRVRKTSFSADIDGASLLNYRPAGKEGGDDGYSHAGGRAEKCLGIAAAHGQVVFGAIEVTEVSGPGVLLPRIRRNDALLRRYAGPRRCDELTFSSDSEHIVGRFPGAGVLAWNLATGRARQYRGESLNCDDDRAALVGEHDFLRVLRYDSDIEPARITRKGLPTHLDDSAALSPDLQFVALWRKSNAADELDLWDATRNTNIRTFGGSSRPAKFGSPRAAFSPNGQFLAGQCGDRENMVRIWDVQTGHQIASTQSKFRIGGPIERPVFSSNGAYLLLTRRVTAIAEDAPWVIDTRSGAELLLALAHDEGYGALSPTAPLLLTVVRNAGQNRLHLWDLTTRRGSFPFPDIPSRVNALAFAPAGDRVLAGSDDGWLRLFDLATGKQLAAFFAHDGSVDHVTYSPDGHLAASAGYDRGICVWKLPGPFVPVPLRHRSAPAPQPVLPPIATSAAAPASRPTLVANAPKVDSTPAQVPTPAPVSTPAPATRAIASPLAAGQKIRALIVDGQNTDNWRATTPLLKTALESCGLFVVDIATSPPRGAKMDGFKPEFANYEVIVSNYNGDDWPQATRKAFEEFVTSGGGFVCVRAADNSFPKWAQYNKMIAVGGWGGRNEAFGPMLRWRDGKVEKDIKGGGGAKDPPRSFVVEARESHPITDGLPARWLHAKDELYTKLCGPADNATVLATVLSDHTYENEPVMLAIKYGSGRVFHSMLGHNEESMKDLGFVVTLCRGAEWAATGRVTQPAPPDFPTAEKLRPWDPGSRK